MEKGCTFRGDKYEVRGHAWRCGRGEWQEITDTEATICSWQESGLYHELFSTSPNVIVPEHVLSRVALNLSVPRWTLHVINTIFEPADAHGYRAPIKLHGKKLAADAVTTTRLLNNTLKRILKCQLPPELSGHPDWRKTGAQACRPAPTPTL